MPIKIKPLSLSQQKRVSKSTLDEMLINFPKSRISEDHGSQYIASHLNGEFDHLDITVSCDRKLKVSAVAIKAKGDSVSIQISGIQVSYKTLPEALVLVRKLLRAYDDKGILVKFPTGNRAKGMSAKLAKVAEEYDISRFDAFDGKIACGASHACSDHINCGYSFIAVNCPNPDQPYSCPKCGKYMVSSRINYNYRIDNSGKHWSTLLPKEFKSSISVFSQAFRSFSYKDQLSILEIQGMKADELPEGILNVENTLQVKVEKKVSEYTELSYAKLKKLVFKYCKENNVDRPTSLKREKLETFAKANNI